MNTRHASSSTANDSRSGSHAGDSDGSDHDINDEDVDEDYNAEDGHSDSGGGSKIKKRGSKNANESSGNNNTTCCDDEKTKWKRHEKDTKASDPLPSRRDGCEGDADDAETVSSQVSCGGKADGSEGGGAGMEDKVITEARVLVQVALRLRPHAPIERILSLVEQALTPLQQPQQQQAMAKTYTFSAAHGETFLRRCVQYDLFFVQKICHFSTICKIRDAKTTATMQPPP